MRALSQYRTEAPSLTRRAGWLGSRSVTEPAPDPGELALQAAHVIAERTGVVKHDVAIVLGSGWSPAVAALGSPTVVLPQAEIPGFSPPTAVGHTGELLSVPIGSHLVLVLVGRVHAYEGHDLRHVVHPVRAACAAGAKRCTLASTRSSSTNQRSPRKCCRVMRT